MTNSIVESPPQSPKTIVRSLLNRMAEDASFAEIVEEIRIAAALEEAFEDVREGRVSSHEEFKERLKLWPSA